MDLSLEIGLERLLNAEALVIRATLGTAQCRCKKTVWNLEKKEREGQR